MIMKAINNMRRRCLLSFALLFTMATWLNAQKIQQAKKVLRLDSLYYAAATASNPQAEIARLVREDPANADWLAYRVLDPNAQEEHAAEVLLRMYRHPQLLRLYADTETAYSRGVADSIARSIIAAFDRLQQLEPTMAVPQYVGFHVSGLQQSVVALPDLVSVAIDKYIRPDYPIYVQFFSDYERQTMSPEYVVRDALLGWICSERPLPRETVLTLRFQLEYWGDIFRLMRAVFPDATEEWLFGFTSEQLQWLRQNKKILLSNAQKRREMESSQPSVTDRYFRELPPDQLLPPEAPRLIGYWLGANL